MLCVAKQRDVKTKRPHKKHKLNNEEEEYVDEN